LNRRVPDGTHGGVRGRGFNKFPPTRFISNSALKFPILQWIYRIRQEMTNKKIK